MTNPLFLQSFLAVYRTGSQTRAAEELHLTQPAISQHIKIIEKRIGKPLFIREAKGLKPTASAHQLALQIGHHLDAIDDFWQTFTPQNTAVKTIYIGGTREFIATDIIPALSHLLKDSSIRLRFLLDSDHLAERLVSNEIDIAISVHPLIHSQIDTEVLYQEKFAIVAHPKWKLSNQKKLTRVKQLNTLPWVVYDEHLLFVKEYYQHVLVDHFSGEIKLVINDLWSLLAAVNAGIGISVLPLYVCQSSLLEKKIIILDQPTKARPLLNYFQLAWKTGALRSTTVSTVINFLRDRFAACRN